MSVCRFGDRSIEAVITNLSEEYTNAISLRGAEKAPLRLPGDQAEGAYAWPGTTLAGGLENRCQGDAVAFDAGEGRAWFLYIDDRLVSGNNLTAALVDLTHWRVLDTQLIGRVSPCKLEAPIALRPADSGFYAHLEVLRITDSCDTIEGWAGVRAANGKIERLTLSDWSPLEKLLDEGVYHAGEHAGQLAEEVTAGRQHAAASRNRKGARAANEKGLALLGKNDLAAAVAAFEEGLRSDGEDVELLNNLGYAYLLQGLLDEAADRLREALLRAPKRVNAWVNLGQVFAAKSGADWEPQLAIGCFSLGLRLSSKPDKTLTFIRALPDRDPAPGLRTAVDNFLAQEWVRAMPGAGATQRETFRDCPNCPEMVDLEGGTFRMGSDSGEEDERPVHDITLAPFAIGRYEVTKGQFAAFVRATSYQTDAERGDGCYGWTGSKWEWDRRFSWREMGFPQEDNHPVACVSWNDAQAYAEWLSRESGREYRLPTEAEWEYAARGGTPTERYWGDDPNQACGYANVADETASERFPGDWDTVHECRDGQVFTAPVGSFKENGFGLMDMLGNLWEWICSEYTGAGYTGKENSCLNPQDTDVRMARGGSWGSEPRLVRSAHRSYNNTPTRRHVGLGFRVARSVPPPKAPTPSPAVPAKDPGAAKGLGCDLPTELASPAEFTEATAMLAALCAYNREHHGTLLPLQFTAGWETVRAETLATPLLLRTYTEHGVERGVLVVARQMLEGGEPFVWHGQGAVLSIYLFRKQGARWHYDRGEAEVMEAGTMGNPPGAKLVRLGEEKYGIDFAWGYFGQGYLESYSSIVALSEPTFSILGAFDLGGDNGGTCSDDPKEREESSFLKPCWSYEGKFEFLPMGEGDYYLLRVAYSGDAADESDPSRILPKDKPLCFRMAEGKYQVLSAAQCEGASGR